MKEQHTVVGILAHVDAGKTTLSEALLFRSGARRSLGRVDHGDAFLDTHDLERERGITIFSKQAEVETENLFVIPTKTETGYAALMAYAAKHFTEDIPAIEETVTFGEDIREKTVTVWCIDKTTTNPYRLSEKLGIAGMRAAAAQQHVYCTESHYGTGSDISLKPPVGRSFQGKTTVMQGAYRTLCHQRAGHIGGKTGACREVAGAADTQPEGLFHGSRIPDKQRRAKLTSPLQKAHSHHGTVTHAAAVGGVGKFRENDRLPGFVLLSDINNFIHRQKRWLHVITHGSQPLRK